MTCKVFVSKIQKEIRGYIRLVISRVSFNFAKLLPDRLYLEHKYKRLMGAKLNIESPVSYNEKLNWLKLYDRNPLYTKLADKYEVRKYIEETIGYQFLSPLLGVWDKVEDIDFDKLPNSFVLKCTHDSGSYVICTDKKDLDFARVKAYLKKRLKTNYYHYSREWVYKNIKPRIIAETLLCEQIYDYKVHCFNEEPTYIEVIGERNHNDHTGKVGIYDFEWELQSWSFGDYDPFDNLVPRPPLLNKLYNLAKKMAKGFKYIRLDYYMIENNIYFGEYTFTPSAGFNTYNNVWTRERDIELGGMIFLGNMKRS